MSLLARGTALTACIAAAALAIAGCGGSSSKSDATTATSAQSGGTGQTVDGVPCNRTEQLNYHVHAHLSLINDGKPEALPALIGIPIDAASGSPECFYFLHTHDTTGVIHIEAPDKRTFTLGQFFAVWGQPLSKNQATNLTGPLHVFVGKKAYSGNPANIKLTPHGLITIESGKRVDPPPFTFPAGL